MSRRSSSPLIAAAGLAALVLAVAAPGARAQTTPAPGGPTGQSEVGRPDASQAAPTEAPDRTAADRSDELRWKDFRLRGRVLLRGVSDRGDGPTASDSDVDAENARLELRWRPNRSFQAVIEGDAADRDRPLKDAYVSFRPGRLELRAGQFKPPVSPIELLSRMELPASERGLLSDVLGYAYGVSGRRPGVQLGWDPRGRGLSLTAGVFRASSVRGDRVGDEAFDNFASDWSRVQATGRVELARRRTDIGVSLNLRPAEPVPGEGFRRFWTAGADFSVGTRRQKGPRAWAEGYVGSSWQDANAFDGTDTTFAAGRVLAAWRLGSGRRRALVLEPYAMASLLEPDTSVVDDLLWETGGGLHATALGHLRLVLEVQHREVARNAPASLGLLPFGETAPRARTRLVAQIGAAF